MPILHRDLETRSRIDLTNRGSYRYASDPSTTVLCYAYAVDDQEPKLWLPGDPIPIEFIEAAHDPAWLVCAHNDQFETVIERYVLAPRFGWPLVDPLRHRCTMAMAAAMSLPQKLDLLAQVLCLKNLKDVDGHKLMQRMCKPVKAKKGENPDVVSWVDDPASMARLGKYCLQDVRVEQEAHGRLIPLPPDELEAWHHFNIINDRGIPIDVRLAEAARTIAVAAGPELNKLLSDLTGGVVRTVGQVKVITSWLASRGVTTAKLGKEHIEELLDDDDLPDDCRHVLEIRLIGSQAASKKAQAFLDRCHDDRIKGAYFFQGASTGRYSSRGAQVQNLKNSTIEGEEELERAINAVYTADYAYVKLHYPKTLQVIGDIGRSMIAAPPGRKLVGVDLSNLESRVLSWAAGEEWKLDAFAKHDVTGLDPHEVYRITASKVLNIPIEKVGKAERTIGKVCDLSLGYNAGHKAIGKKLKHLSEAGVKKIVYTWRDQHPRTVALWNRAQTAAVRCISDKKPTTAGPFTFSYDGYFMKILLPSGRFLYFASAKVITDTKGNRTVTFQEYNSKNKRWDWANGGRGSYGGHLIQNAIQGLSRDLLTGAMLRAEAAGYEIIMSTHDELTAEVPEGFGSATELVEIMIEQPVWAAGLPLNAKGWEGKRYG